MRYPQMTASHRRMLALGIASMLRPLAMTVDGHPDNVEIGFDDGEAGRGLDTALVADEIAASIVHVQDHQAGAGAAVGAVGLDGGHQLCTPSCG